MREQQRERIVLGGRAVGVDVGGRHRGKVRSRARTRVEGTNWNGMNLWNHKAWP